MFMPCSHSYKPREIERSGKDACTMRIWYRHNIRGRSRGIIHGGPMLVDRDEI